jgi:disulfide bond formation protein DsbB
VTLGGLGRDTVEGVRWLWRHQLPCRLCLVAGIDNLVGGGVVAILVRFAKESLGLSSMGFALLLGVSAIAAASGLTAHAFGLRTPFFAAALLLAIACLISPRPTE